MAPFSAVLPPPDATAMAMDPTRRDAGVHEHGGDPRRHLTATANGAPIAVDGGATDDGGSTFPSRPRPAAPGRPARPSSITLDATTTNLLGQTIAAAATVTFTAP